MIQRDKKLHFYVGIIIAIIGSLLFNREIGLFLAVLAALFKDVGHDLILGKGTFELLDILFTVLGGLIIYIALGVIF